MKHQNCNTSWRQKWTSLSSLLRESICSEVCSHLLIYFILFVLFSWRWPLKNWSPRHSGGKKPQVSWPDIFSSCPETLLPTSAKLTCVWMSFVETLNFLEGLIWLFCPSVPSEYECDNTGSGLHVVALHCCLKSSEPRNISPKFWVEATKPFCKSILPAAWCQVTTEAHGRLFHSSNEKQEVL